MAQGLRTFASDVAQGFFEITHNGFALVGLACVFAVITLTARPDLRQAGESMLMSWLKARHEATVGMPVELGAIDRATATDPQGPAETAGGGRLLAQQEVPRGARAAERAGGRSV